MKTNRHEQQSARALAHQRGMTLLEIMIVLAIIALVMGFLIGPRVLRGLSKSETDVARAEAKQLAYQAYTEWKADTRKSCPSSLDELIEYTDKKKNEDPWGNPYQFLCKDKMQNSKHPFGVYSFGPNETNDNGSGDDITSWADDSAKKE